jgi:transposase-like protein
MPWKETDPMTEKERFVHLALSGKFTITELCQEHGISRKTGHKYINRYNAYGRDGLKEFSRRPKTYAKTTDEDIIKLILLVQHQHIGNSLHQHIGYTRTGQLCRYNTNTSVTVYTNTSVTLE